MFTWSSNGWAKKDGAPVDNAADWKELVALVRKAGRAGKRFEMRWVPGEPITFIASTTRCTAP